MVSQLITCSFTPRLHPCGPTGFKRSHAPVNAQRTKQCAPFLSDHPCPWSPLLTRPHSSTPLYRQAPIPPLPRFPRYPRPSRRAHCIHTLGAPTILSRTGCDATRCDLGSRIAARVGRRGAGRRARRHGLSTKPALRRGTAWRRFAGHWVQLRNRRFGVRISCRDRCRWVRGHKLGGAHGGARRARRAQRAQV